MSESISSTIKDKGLTLDSVFVEVLHSEGLGLPKANHIRYPTTFCVFPMSTKEYTERIPSTRTTGMSM